MALAAFTPVGDGRGLIHTELCIAISCADVGECRRECIIATRKRYSVNEIIIDNDEGVDDTHYAEQNGSKKWAEGGRGFAHTREVYLSGQNPFRDGTARTVESIKSGNASRA